MSAWSIHLTPSPYRTCSSWKALGPSRDLAGSTLLESKSVSGPICCRWNECSEIDHVVLECSHEGEEPADGCSGLWLQRIPVEVVVVAP